MKYLPLALALLATPATAADLALKAPVYQGCVLLACTGPYLGGNISETGGNFNVVSTGLSGLSQNSLLLGGEAGYQFWNGKWFIGGEIDGQYGVTQNGALPGGGNSGLWSLGALAKIGGDLSGFFGSITPTTSPVVPSSLTNSVIAGYVILGVWDRPWGAGFASGAGVEALLATNWTISADYIHVNYNNANVNPIVSQQTEDIVKVGVDYHFNGGRL